MKYISAKSIILFLLSFGMGYIAEDSIGADSSSMDPIRTDFNKGLALYLAKNYQGAITSFDIAIKNNGDIAARYFKGYALYHLREYETAREAFVLVYRIDPSYSPRQFMGLPPRPSAHP